MKGSGIEKARIRQRIWRLLEEKNVARFPRPVFGRIPNFVGAELAAQRLRSLPEYQKAETVFCNPDSPQRPVRENALVDGKVLVMATPRLKSGLLLLEPGRIPKKALRRASTIRGAFQWGRKIQPWDVEIDLKVVGSVAVSPEGARLGKGHGYSDLEYAILLECGAIKSDTPIITTVHDLQVVDEIPTGPNDVPVDIIVTPTRTIRAARKLPRPGGIDWEALSPEKLREIPLLSELSRRRLPDDFR